MNKQTAPNSTLPTPTVTTGSQEHWLVLGAGLAAWWFTRKHPSMLLRTAGMIAGTALVGRAASGTGGIAKVLQYLPIGRRISNTPPMHSK